MGNELKEGPDAWLIRKGVHFYRPKRSGYTTVKAEAGRYTRAEAEQEARIEPWHMSAVLADDVPDPPHVADKRDAEITRLTEEVLRLKANLKDEIDAFKGLTVHLKAAESRAKAAEARVERMRLYCSAAATDFAGLANLLKENSAHFPKTVQDLLETSEFMALAAEGKENGTLYEDELSKAQARVKVLEEALRSVSEQCRPQSNATVKRMARIAEAALSTHKEG